jgi:hypothetical protein
MQNFMDGFIRLINKPIIAFVLGFLIGLLTHADIVIK